MRRVRRKALALIVLLAAGALGCNQQAKRDSVRLDSILSTQVVDLIEMESLYRTNYLRGSDLQIFMAALNKTNRQAASDWSKDQVAHSFTMMDGTNKVLVPASFENGLRDFGDYCFRLKS